ncbi:MAG: 2OG-Fe(II) oxygenase [Spiribacter salinus]|uniref:2OG-Fe(II) oxygenase n=1 Tax=Spiribacter salinus TaxID=1335746 RepID=A0A540VQH6_9GAMM|nr:MAG: 2OG-Fe(II) oxygenase [Spiribacter salinus]
MKTARSAPSAFTITCRNSASRTGRLDEYIQTREFLGWLERMTGIDELFYDPDYFGGGTHENRHGQDLDPHVDFNKYPKTGLHRRLNLIIYLNREWHDEWGGAIEFHKEPRLPPEQNEIEYVQPKFNRAVLFETTHWSWHGFERNQPAGGRRRSPFSQVGGIIFLQQDAAA